MDDFGSDFITITDEDGVEYELEILSELVTRAPTIWLWSPPPVPRKRNPRNWK